MDLPRQEERDRARDALREWAPLRSRRVVHVRSDEPRTGRHRRVFAKDLCAYRELRREESREAFEELAAASQDHDLGY